MYVAGASVNTAKPSVQVMGCSPINGIGKGVKCGASKTVRGATEMR